MSMTYTDVLERLKEERNRLAWSQKEMSQQLRMSQSNYSKIELGLRRLNYYELKYLSETAADVHYIYTARRSSGKYQAYFEACSYQELICYLSIVYSIISLQYKKQTAGQLKNVFEDLQYVPLVEEKQNTHSIFWQLRRSINLQQQKMAEMIGVDVKKLRDLENGRCLPDSELLYRLYDLFRIPPAVILKDAKGMASELALLLETLEMKGIDGIFDVIQSIRDMN